LSASGVGCDKVSKRNLIVAVSLHYEFPVYFRV